MISDHLPPDWEFLRNEIDEIQKIIGKEFIPIEKFVLRAIQEPISKARVVIIGHENVGWQNVTKRIVEKYRDNGCVFILWGKQAQSLEKMIPSEQRISGVHPSPLSAYRGFFGSKPFSTANSMLLKLGLLPIDWKI